MAKLADSIAKCVLDKYASLPLRCRLRNQTRLEWTIVAGVVLNDRSDLSQHGHSLSCVALATGMKCLSRNKIQTANGNILHDWHAEILCLRAFNRWLVDECQVLHRGGESRWLEARMRPAATPFRLRDTADIHMFVSTAPCGDASMELVMAAQSDATPWPAPAPSTAPGDMLGRGQFDQLGAVRRKPSRPDAPVTWSKSCSDKLALKQCTSLLCSLTSGLVDPASAYLKTLVLPESEIVQEAIARAFSPAGRLATITDAVQGQWQSGYRFRPFDVLPTALHFQDAKVEGAVPSNMAVLSTSTREEVLINGVLQGRKQSDTRGASCASRRRLACDSVALQQAVGAFSSYADLKKRCDTSRQRVKDDVRMLALSPWKSNDGDDGWIVQ